MVIIQHADPLGNGLGKVVIIEAAETNCIVPEVATPIKLLGHLGLRYILFCFWPFVNKLCAFCYLKDDMIGIKKNREKYLESMKTMKLDLEHLGSSEFDPYLNTDVGTMSPFEHEEFFVLGDGGEVVPHITDAIKNWIEFVSVILVDGKNVLQIFVLLNLDVVCVTTDFAMQHVLLQIGLRLLAPGGMQIRGSTGNVVLCSSKVTLLWGENLPLQMKLMGDLISLIQGKRIHIPPRDIIQRNATYKGSDSEPKDLLELYKKLKGNMEKYFLMQ
ncbi:CTP synthase family protein [Striga asiatica]|uniref:CTP synthase family protein n=1 Tax=Striga asiatica TaxID=4170 RepID=A0A5A7QRT5_STRAF|nr:CTP synthase family protein [Striga asiatica]